MATATIQSSRMGRGVNISRGLAKHSNLLFKTGILTTPSATTNVDSLTGVDLYQNFGFTRPLGFVAIDQETDNSVFAEGVAGTSSVDRGLFSMSSIGGTSAAATRTFIVYGV